VTGHLHLELAATPDGRTQIAKQSFQAPLHISKPHWDGRTLIVQAVNCTAGTFGGDQLHVSILAKSHTSAVITSPSAQRIHPPRDKSSPALVTQHFEIQPGAWLDIAPEILIPHKDSRLVQRTHLHTHTGSELLYLEALAPGRVGYGESYQFAALDWTTDWIHDNRLLSRERFVLNAESESLKILLMHSPTPYQATAYLTSPHLAPTSPLPRQIAELDTENCRIATSFIDQNAALIRLLATDSIYLRSTISSLRQIIYSHLNRHVPEWRKL
jgi:urease accessory protein